jgi:hypothetical protein
MLIAEFTKGSKVRSAQVTIWKLVNGRRQDGVTHLVTGKTEAREIASVKGAKPWNF